MHRVNEIGYALVPIAVLVLSRRLDSARTGFRHVDVSGVDCRSDGSLPRVWTTPTSLARCSRCCLAIGILIMSAPYRRRRLLTFLNPWEDPLGDGFQIIQSLIAIGTGGLFGKGVSERRPEAVLSA